jgi:hypothetical protein
MAQKLRLPNILFGKSPNEKIKIERFFGWRG